jgi:BirA family biotin operon repressor/biotin-[acetyl-CoA-carboxylase] ligase
LVSAHEQTAGRGRQGRTWVAPPGRALLFSIVIREPPRLLPLAAGVAVAEVAGEMAGEAARVKWPNDVLVDGRKIAGILVEGRPAEGWAVLGIGLNVALREEDFPVELRGVAGTLGLEPSDVEDVLARLLSSLTRCLSAPDAAVSEALRARDALAGRRVRWHGGEGVADGIDEDGRLLVRVGGGAVALDAGEVHLQR